MSLQLIAKLEEKCNGLPLDHKKALSADADDIMCMTPRDVRIYFDDDGQHEVFTCNQKQWIDPANKYCVY